MANIFEDKTTIAEALAQWPQKVAQSLDEPQSRDRPVPGLRVNGEMDVKNVIRSRRGHDY